MNRLICAFALLLTVGCTKAVFRPYVGSQQAWPTAEGSIVNTKYKLPVFTNLPPSPYEVLGEIRVESPLYAQPEEHHMPIVCKRADKLGADAILFVQGRVYFSTNYGPRPGDTIGGAGGGAKTLSQVNTFNPESFAQGVTLLAIKWTGEPPPGLAKQKTAPIAEEPVVAPMIEESLPVAPEIQPEPAPVAEPVAVTPESAPVPAAVEEPAPAPAPAPTE